MSLTLYFITLNINITNRIHKRIIKILNTKALNLNINNVKLIIYTNNKLIKQVNNIK